MKHVDRSNDLLFTFFSFLAVVCFMASIYAYITFGEFWIMTLLTGMVLSLFAILIYIGRSWL